MAVPGRISAGRAGPAESALLGPVRVARVVRTGGGPPTESAFETSGGTVAAMLV
jgi:hypothetical protein